MHVHALFDMSRVVFGQFVLLVLLIYLSRERTRSIFSTPRIPNNLRERAIGMVDAGMSTEHIARHVGCSSRAKEIQQEAPTTRHVDIRVMQRVVKTAIS